MVEEKENNSLSWMVYILAPLVIIVAMYLLFGGGEYGDDLLGQIFSFGKPQYHISNAFGIVK
tara:strand:- start:797 stop:982 length:186 start_codon:yes stop_codon:yes gene_type:complete